MSTWMYQFWLFSFKTAKHWGRGPQDWTADILGFHKYRARRAIGGSVPCTPSDSAETPAASHSTPANDAGPGFKTEPTPLCRWSIHCAHIRYQRIPSPPPSANEQFDIDDEKNWPTWGTGASPQGFTEKVTAGLQSNSFSPLEAQKLPIDPALIAGATRRSTNEFSTEAFGFAIMSRNEELVEGFMEKKLDFVAMGLFPFHLAASYLDGAKSCCRILDILQEFQPVAVRELFVNDLGHTILDQLMICIVKSHTSCSPSVVDLIFKTDRRFEGEDVSICGRWDADSECVRVLLNNGNSAIPFEWKHMFCHTSAQAICHSIGTIFGPRWAPNINHPSGLFGRRCAACGLKLQLSPLHTLILVAMQLSLVGCQGETLFGVVACLLCLLRHGANPLAKVEVSIHALVSESASDVCTHQELDPLEFSKELLWKFQMGWPMDLIVGWQILLQILMHAQRIRTYGSHDTSDRPGDGVNIDSDDVDDDVDDVDDPLFSRYEEEPEMHKNPVRRNFTPLICPLYPEAAHRPWLGKDGLLGSLWAAIQVELLTYRRLQDYDAWTSRHFDMHALVIYLCEGRELALPLLSNGMMKPFCCCGTFPGAVPGTPILDDATAYYFSNLDDYSRSSFLNTSLERPDRWYYHYIEVDATS